MRAVADHHEGELSERHEIERVVLEDVAELIGLAAAHESVIRIRDEVAGDVATAVAPAQRDFERLQAAVRQIELRFPESPREWQQIQVSRWNTELEGSCRTR